MIITCPSCKRRFELRSKIPSIFHCPKCHYQAPFQSILDQNSQSATDVPPVFDATTMKSSINSEQAFDPNQPTQVYVGNGTPQQDKTKLVVTCGHLHILNNNSVVKDVALKLGTPTLGRLSSDSQASIKIAPDPYMSRIHARMKISLEADGQVQYIITPVKQNSPIFLENKQIPFGKSAILHNGCKIKMGETEMLFVIK